MLLMKVSAIIIEIVALVVPLVKFTVLSIKLLFYGASLIICLTTSVRENCLKTC